MTNDANKYELRDSEQDHIVDTNKMVNDAVEKRLDELIPIPHRIVRYKLRQLYETGQISLWVPTVEEIAKAAYEQHMKNANVEGKFEVNLTEIGIKHWCLVGQAVRALLTKGRK